MGPSFAIDDVDPHAACYVHREGKAKEVLEHCKNEGTVLSRCWACFQGADFCPKMYPDIIEDDLVARGIFNEDHSAMNCPDAAWESTIATNQSQDVERKILDSIPKSFTNNDGFKGVFHYKTISRLVFIYRSCRKQEFASL